MDDRETNAFHQSSRRLLRVMALEIALRGGMVCKDFSLEKERACWYVFRKG